MSRQRIVDLAVGLPLAILTLPVVIVFGAISVVVFRGRPIFAQPRLGKDGEVFTFVKLRSLPRSVPTDVDKHQLKLYQNSSWGAFIRHRHLDELPQLWLVVAGKMSLVGPRPEMPALASTFDPDFVARRTTVRPGCTGLWQISTACTGLIGEAPEFDLYYVRNRSERLDLWILLRTIRIFLGGNHLDGLDEIPGRFADGDGLGDRQGSDDDASRGRLTSGIRREGFQVDDRT